MWLYTISCYVFKKKKNNGVFDQKADLIDQKTHTQLLIFSNL